MPSCCAVFITYNPDLPTLERAIVATVNQVDTIYIIDNASSVPLKYLLAKYDQVQGVFLDKNLGLAAGFNIGIQRARAAGYHYLLLLDQDSIPPADMVQRYLLEIERLRSEGEAVAAVGPRYRDPRTGHTSSFVRFSWFRNRYVRQEPDSNNNIQADFLISSGSFYPIDVFDQVGLFDEGLFIDHVDTEWCLRATARGYHCFGVWDVVMDHSLGEGSFRMWWLRWREHPLHKPFRLYFIVRNSLLLYRKKYVPLKFISADVLRLIRLFFVHLFFSPDRREILRWCSLGLAHGIGGVVGSSAVFKRDRDEAIDPDKQKT